MDMTTFQFTKNLINSMPIDGTLAKHEIRLMFKRQYGQVNGLTTVYVYISSLLKSGYLRAAQSPGFYIVLKHIDEDFKLSDLKTEYHKNKEYVKEIVENVEQGQVGGTHYKRMKVQPIILICQCNMSFIQGSIVKYIVRYKYKNGIEDIEKVIHYAKFAIVHSNSTRMPSATKKYVFDYCNVNDLDEQQSAVIRFATENKYKHIIDVCEALIESLKAADKSEK